MATPNPIPVGAPAPAAEPGFEGLTEVSQSELPEPGFEGLEPVTADAGFENLVEADRLDLEDETKLSSDDAFRPAQFIAENPNVAQEPERFQKLLNVYRQKRVKGLEFGKVAKAAVTEAPGVVAKTVKGAGQLVKRVVDIGVQPAVNEVLGFVTGTDMAPLREETRKQQLKSAGEIAAGTEAAATGISQLAQQGGRKLFGKDPEKATDSELYDQLLLDSEYHKLTSDIAQGKSDLSKTLGLDADFLAKNGVQLDPEAIENLSLVDPLTLVATGGVFKIVGTGGKIIATAATRAGGQAVINGFKNVAAKTVQAVGKGVEKTGQVAQKIPLRTPSAVAVGGQIATGNIAGAAATAVAPMAVRGAGRAAEAAGRVISEVGERMQPGFIGPPTAAAARLSKMAASPVAQVAGTAAKGAAAGAGLAAPLALASDDSQTAGAILGGGAALGAAAGGALATARVGKNAVANIVARKYLDPKSIPFEPVESPGYGINKNLDTVHEAAIKSLPAPEQNAINNFREALRAQGGEIYVQDPQAYLERVRETLRNQNGGAELTPQQEALAQTYADTHAFFDGFVTDAAGNQRRTVFLNSGAKGLPHDAGHLFQSMLAPERQAQLRQAVFDSYTPQQLQEFGRAYTEALGDAEFFNKLGEEAAREKIADEIIAENFSQLFGNTRLADLKAPPKFLETLGRTAVEAGESLGLDLTAGRTTPDLGVSPTFRLQNLLRNASQEVLNLPATKERLTLTKATLPEKVPTAAEIKPVSPETPSSPGGEIPVLGKQPPTPEAPKPAAPDAAAQRAKETGIAEARELVKDNPEVSATVDTISKSMEAGNPALKIEHRGITAEVPPGPAGESRGPRRATQAKGYAELEALQIDNRANAPESIVSVHEKTFVPVRWVNQGGKATLIAMSMDKVMGNVRKIVEESAANKAESLIPYESVGGELTEKGWTDAMADLKTYAENQSNGFRGDGARLVRPSDAAGVSIPAENPNYTPKTLGETQANFANLVQGLAPPQTARAPKGQVPGNVKAQLIAEANLRTPQPVAKISAKDIGAQTFAKPFEGRTVKETNPLRNELSSRGVDIRTLKEVTERFAAEDIASIGEAAPEAQMKAPVTDVIRGGFLPGVETDKAIRSGFLPDTKPSQPTPSGEIRDLAASYAKSAGVDYKPSRVYASVEPEVLKQLADFYDSAKSSPEDPAVKASYQALANETLAQYRTMEAAGYKIEPFTGQGEPYKSSAEAVSDIRDNKHLFFLQTDKAFGTGAEPSTNPMLADSGVVINGQRLPVNDVFRAVHDFFGHGKEGYQFGPRGEFNTWRSHSEMYSPEAQGALAAETLAQNAWVNFGKHIRNPDGSIPQRGQPGYKSPQERPFADQKNVVVPADLIERARAAASQEPKFLPAGKTVEQFGNEIIAMSPDEWKKANESWDGGLTQEAYSLGHTLTDSADVARLAQFRDAASAQFKEIMATGDFEAAYPAAGKGQFFAEAYGAATDTGSAANPRLGWRKYFPDTPAPFPAAKEGPSFLPKTAKGKELVEKGYDFRLGGFDSTRSITVIKDGKAVGEIQSARRTPETAEIVTVWVQKSHRGTGAAEAVYRELLTQLKEDGVTEISGHVISDKPLALRKKIFGAERNKVTDAFEAEVPIDEAMERLSGGELGFEVKSKITPEMDFLPRKKKSAKVTPEDIVERDERGRPLTAEGLVDYEKLAAENTAKQRQQEAADIESMDVSKYETPDEFTPSGETATGWVLPDGKFVPIDAAYHQDWLARNSEQLNKDFKTAFSDTASVEERLDALNAGFVRVRDNRGANTIVELNSKFWKGATKQQVEDLLTGGKALPDRFTVTLLDNEGNVVDSVSARLFDSENPAGDAADALGQLKAATAERRKVGPSDIQRARAMGEPTEPQFLPKGVTVSETPGEGGVRRLKFSKGGKVVATARIMGTTLGDVEVIPSERRKGLATAILKHLKEAEGVSEAFAGSEAGEKLLESVGERQEGGRFSFLPSEGKGEQYRVIWKPRKEGKTTFSQTVMASSPEEAQSKVVPKGGFFVEAFTEESVNQAAQEGLSGGVLKSLEDQARKDASGPQFLPKPGTPEFNDYVDARIKESRTFPEAIPVEFRKDEAGNYRVGFNGDPIAIAKDYDLGGTLLAKKSKAKTPEATEEKFTDALANGLEKEYRAAKRNPAIEAGETWYSVAREKLQALLGEDTKFFAELLGATSPQTGVETNFGFALDAYNQFKRGAFDGILEKYREGKAKFKNGEIEEFTKATGKKGAKATYDAFMNWWVDENSLVPVQSNGKRFGMNSKAVLRVLDGSWLANVKGPKTPNFTGNLVGSTFEATIDIWAMRMLHRLANEGNTKRWRIQPANEIGVTDADFFTGQKAFRKAADKLGVQPDSLQAILWFAEKDLWEKNGWTRSAGRVKSDYNVLLQKTEKTKEGMLKRVDKQLSFSDIEGKE